MKYKVEQTMYSCKFSAVLSDRKRHQFNEI